jgi:hypothetical protein
MRCDGRTRGPARAGWVPAVRGGWRKGVRHEDRQYLSLTKEVVRGHLAGEAHVGLYPLLDGDLCWVVGGGFQWALGDVGRVGICEGGAGMVGSGWVGVSRSGIGAHVWVFFAAPVPAERHES